MAVISLHFTQVTEAPSDIYDAEFLPRVIPRSFARFPLCPCVSDRAEFFPIAKSVAHITTETGGVSPSLERTKGLAACL